MKYARYAEYAGLRTGQFADAVLESWSELGSGEERNRALMSWMVTKAMLIETPASLPQAFTCGNEGWLRFLRARAHGVRVRTFTRVRARAPCYRAVAAKDGALLQGRRIKR